MLIRTHTWSISRGDTWRCLLNVYQINLSFKQYVNVIGNVVC